MLAHDALDLCLLALCRAILRDTTESSDACRSESRSGSKHGYLAQGAGAR